MGIIEAKNLVHEYIIRDEEGNVEKAFEQHWIIWICRWNRGSLSLFWDITAPKVDVCKTFKCAFDADRRNFDCGWHGCVR